MMTDGPLSQLIYMAFVWPSAASLECNARQMSLFTECCTIQGWNSGTRMALIAMARHMDLKTGKEQRKRGKRRCICRNIEVYCPSTCCHTCADVLYVLMCSLGFCLCMCFREREVNPSASITVTWREIDCVCVVR